LKSARQIKQSNDRWTAVAFAVSVVAIIFDNGTLHRPARERVPPAHAGTVWHRSTMPRCAT